MDFHELKIHKIIKETENAKSYLFSIPDELKESFTYKAGQYLTLEINVDGKNVRRAYSMSSSPGEMGPKVTVKRVTNGIFTNKLLDSYKEGDSIKVGTPEGRFTLKFDPSLRRSHYCICAGSGITPIISLIKEALEQEPLSQIFLLYGNRNKEEVIFLDELNSMQEKYQGQFEVDFCYSQEKSSGVFSMFKKKDFFEGRINAEIIRKFMVKHPQENEEAHFFLCGPGEIINFSKNYLSKRGVENKYIHEEYFTTVVDKTTAMEVKPGDSLVEVQLQGENIEFMMHNSQTILAKLDELGYDAPYSCMAGACSTCMAKIIEGEVVMDSSLALNEQEIADGYILTCQSHPSSSKLRISYDM